jgi:ATP-dependent RNA helicase RhlE
MYNQSSHSRRSPASSFARSSQNRRPYSGYAGNNGPSRSFGRPAKRRFAGQYIDVNKFIRKADITTPVEVYQSRHMFADFALNPILKSNIAAKGYTTPTAIQDQTIPYGLEGKDIIGMANTGTGKTAAFLIPLIHKMTLHTRERVLIMTPTRELALQIQQELKDFSRGLNQFSTLCIGGANIGQQISQLRRQPHFVIGTPGRLKDLLERRCLDLSQFRSVVLDEADRMLDMGFIEDIQALLALLPAERQTLFFSATMSSRIRMLTERFLNQPVTVSVKTQETAANVDQDVVRISHEDDKLDTLHELLIKKEFSKVLIFGQTKHGVERLSDTLAKRGFRSVCIHGNKTQPARQRALNTFKQNEAQIMVATDVAARGLDIPAVSHVINYDIPATYDDYIHRIGRTGRADQKGYALTFVTR